MTYEDKEMEHAEAVGYGKGSVDGYARGCKVTELTLRDQYAMVALLGLASFTSEVQQRAKQAYKLANAMMEARKENT